MASVFIAVSDLLFQSRLEAAARSLGLSTRVVDDPASIGVTEASPTLVIVDLHETAFDPPEMIRSAKSAGAKVLAFGRHTEPATLRAARAAGADAAVPRSQLVEELRELLSSLTAPKEAGTR